MDDVFKNLDATPKDKKITDDSEPVISARNQGEEFLRLSETGGFLARLESIKSKFNVKFFSIIAFLIALIGAIFFGTNAALKALGNDTRVPFLYQQSSAFGDLDIEKLRKKAASELTTKRTNEQTQNNNQQSTNISQDTTNIPSAKSDANNGIQAIQTQPNITTGIMTDSVENEYVAKIEQMSSDLFFLKNQVEVNLINNTRLEDRLSEVEQINRELSNVINTMNFQVANKLDAIDKTIMASEDANLQLKINGRDISEIKETIRSSERLTVQNETNIKSIADNIKSFTASNDGRIDDIQKELVKIGAVISNKGHIEDLPRRVNFLNGKKVTSIDDAIKYEKLAEAPNYSNKEKIANDYNYLATTNNFHYVTNNAGRTYKFEKGDSIANYGYIVDYVKSADMTKSYLVMSSGYIITSKTSKLLAQ